MLEPIIEKVIVNVCTGRSGESLERAMKILKSITGQKPIRRRAKQTIRGFGITKGEPIACMVTLRKEKAVDFLKRALKAVGDTLSISNFDNSGNFSFGIREHIDIPGIKYDPKLGMIGMDVCVTIVRKGWRVRKRRWARARIGHSHRLTREEAIAYIKENFGVKIE